MKKLFILIIVLVFGVSSAFALPRSKKPLIWAYSNGNGTVQLFWIPGSFWPAGGWRIERMLKGKHTLLSKKIVAGGDFYAMQKLSKEDAASIKSFSIKLKSGSMNKSHLAFAKIIFSAEAAANTVFGEALGLRYIDKPNISGNLSYKVGALNKKGKVVIWSRSIQINPGKVSKKPPSVGKITPTISINGVALYWQKPKSNKNNPVIGYRIKRIDPDGSEENVTQKTLLVSDDLFGKHIPIIIDKNAPLEKIVVYKIYSVGFFENLSKPKSIKVFVEDLRALMPPLQFTVKSKEESAYLKWNKNPSPYCAGYLVEKSFSNKGPFVVITPKGLKRDATEYVDKNLKGGTAYYYRIRSINLKGKIGEASFAKMANLTSKAAPPVVKNLRADIGISEIKLRWEKPKTDVAGYLVYRKPKDAKKWSQLNTYVVPDEFYEDSYSSKTYGEFYYRIVTVGYDSKKSAPSKSVIVKLIDSISPNPPHITNINSSRGEVKIYFKAAPPINDIDYFLLVRSVSENDQGLVIGDKISADKTKVSDKFVKYGKRYWYRMVAVDKSGNRSNLSLAQTVVVQNPPIPTPDAPKLRYKDKPIPHIVINIKKPSKRLVAVIQKRTDKQWKFVASATDNTPIVDLKINKNEKIYYRVLYQSENGAQGKASKSSEIKTK